MTRLSQPAGTNLLRHEVLTYAAAMELPHPPVDQIDLSDFDFWTQPPDVIEGAFPTLRAERPIAFFEEPVVELLPPGPGYFALSRHADVVEASRHPDLFCSGRGTNIGDMPDSFNEFFGSMINMDDPRHARMRRIVSRGFTPRQLDSIEGTSRPPRRGSSTTSSSEASATS